MAINSLLAEHDLNSVQRCAVDHLGLGVVVGAPGSGKTTAALWRVFRRVQQSMESLAADGLRLGASDAMGQPPVLLWCADRHKASRARDTLVAALAQPVRRALAMTVHSWAFGVLRSHAASEGMVAPVLISGPEQDARLAELLVGHSVGDGRDPLWPRALHDALGCVGFRDELRDFLMRCAEYGLTPADVADVGRQADRPEWVSAASVYAEYLETTALSGQPAFDNAALLTAAADVIAESAAPQVLLGGVRDVVIDDAQELSAGAIRLVRLLVEHGVNVTMFGDPDASTLGFRGADPGVWLAEQRWAPASAPVQRLVLPVRYTADDSLTALAQRCAQHIGVQGTHEHRLAVAGAPHQAQVSAPLFRSQSHEFAGAAEVLRTSYAAGVSWSRMAVVVRSGAAVASVQSALRTHGIPVDAAATHTALRDFYAVQLMRTLSDVVAKGTTVTTDAMDRLLISDVCQFDPLHVGLLRDFAEKLLPLHEHTDAVVALVLSTHELPDSPLFAPVRTLRRIIAGAQGAQQAQAGPHQVLWQLWSGARVAERWRQEALGGGRLADRADESLDAMMALFDAAARYADDRPGSELAGFWRHLDAQHIASDTLADSAAGFPAVTVGTPSVVAGRHFHTVVVLGVQEGLWPNPSIRDSLLGAAELADIMRGRQEVGQRHERVVRQQILTDEVRMFLVATSRATHVLSVSAVADDTVQPSGLHALVVEDNNDAADEPAVAVATPHHMCSPYVFVAWLRGQLTSAVLAHDPVATQRFAQHMSALDQAGVRGADPKTWWRPIAVPSWQRVPDGELVRVSPSKVQAATECPLRWFLQTNNLGRGSSLSSRVGTLVHKIAADYPQGPREQVMAALDELWPTLNMPESWWSVVEYERVKKMLAHWCGYLAGCSREVVAVEEVVAAPVRGGYVAGAVDRLEQDKNGLLYVVDLKTGSSAVTKEDAQVHPQLGVYQAAIRAGGHPAGTATGGAELVFVGTKNKSVARRGQDALAEDGSFVDAVMDEAVAVMRAGSYVPVPSSMCRSCEFRASCPTTAQGVAGQYAVGASSGVELLEQ